jgi:hypothetical protein
MRTRILHQYALPLIALLLAGPTCGVVAAQGTPDLASENQRLQGEVDRLTRELKASQDRVKILEQQLTALQRARGSATQPATEPEKVTVDESVPTASPRALYNAMTSSYGEHLSTMQIGSAGDSTRRGYMRKVEQWKGLVDREFRGPITWHVRLVGNETIRPNQPIRLTAVDPVTSVQLGDAFEVTLPRLAAERLAKMQQRSELGVMVLRGIVAPAVRVADDRETRGPIDNPPFIGPFAEFIYSVQVQSLLPVKEDESEQKNQKAENPKP